MSAKSAISAKTYFWHQCHKCHHYVVAPLMALNSVPSANA
jgi:hypothetical protein